ncbi:MAG: phage portal protein [Rhizobiales bacterium]|nr:phage portal protein [Hyphomicrobiales bacterium]
MSLVSRLAAGIAFARSISPLRTKSAPGHHLVAFHDANSPRWSPRDYGAFAREGFMQNAVVYRSVRLIAEAAASVPLVVTELGRRLDTHPLVELIEGARDTCGAADFFEAWYGYLLVAGNAYCEVATVSGEPRELRLLRPDRISVLPGRDGWIDGYIYSVGGERLHLRDDPDAPVSRVLHLGLFHPLDDHFGFSPIEAAAPSIDIHNASARWNKALLDNAARPSGALVYQAAQGNLSDEQFARLKEELEASYQGARNAGRPLLLEGGLDWKSMALSPKDMDFIEARNAAAREIALAIGVPPMLLGIPGDNTYANLQEANRTFWRQTVLPLVRRTLTAFERWLAPAFGEPVRLCPDLEAIAALASEREAHWKKIEAASFLTLNERRAAVGYPPVAGGDRIVTASEAGQRGE